MTDTLSLPVAAPQARYQTLQTGLDLLDQGLSIFDSDLRLVAWNTAYVRLLAFPSEMAYLGAPFESFIRYNAQRGEYGLGDPEAQVAERVAAAYGFAPHDIERIRPDGRVLHIHGEPVPGHGFVTLYSDVTAQRVAERTIRQQNAGLEHRVAMRTAELLRSEQRVRLIMDSIPALVAYFDQNRVYQYLNRSYHDWFRVDTASPEAASARSFLGDAVYSVVKPQVMRALSGESVSFEYALVTHAGQQLAVRTSLIPERAGDGRIAGCFELTFDITEQKRSQEVIARAQKFEALGQLTGGLAHDFNNILTVVIGNLAVLARERPSDPLIMEYVQPALDASRRGADLVKGLLSFARRQPLRAGAVDVMGLIDTVARLVRRTLPDRLQLRIETGGGALWAWIDAGLLEQALLNLILNARDATPDGRIVLSAHAAQLDDDRAAALQMNAGSCVCIEVNDNGMGMDADTLTHIFEPFFTTKQPGSGTGLGMAMVYGFIKQSGGAIDVRSQPGQGTNVSLWLPASDASVAQAVAPSGPAPPPTGGRGLALLVDDDPQVRRVICHSLTELGYVVLEAGNGTEALRLLENTEDIAVLLSDVVMSGGLDGREVARVARLKMRAKAVVLMSGYAPGALGAADLPLLTKPFSTFQLAQAIEEAQL